MESIRFLLPRFTFSSPLIYLLKTIFYALLALLHHKEGKRKLKTEAQVELHPCLSIPTLIVVCGTKAHSPKYYPSATDLNTPHTALELLKSGRNGYDPVPHQSPLFDYTACSEIIYSQCCSLECHKREHSEFSYLLRKNAN